MTLKEILIAGKLTVSEGGGGGGDPYEALTALNNDTLETWNAKGITKIRARLFQGSSHFITLVAPDANIISAYLCQSGGPQICDLGAEDVDLQNACFNGGTIDTLILRASTVRKIGHINVFNQTPFALSGTGGTLYVPQALISAYQAATNWSTILGYANNKILPIEGSIYENAYADGTPIT